MITNDDKNMTRMIVIKEILRNSIMGTIPNIFYIDTKIKFKIKL
jgi:hypothetical protein